MNKEIDDLIDVHLIMFFDTFLMRARELNLDLSDDKIVEREYMIASVLSKVLSPIYYKIKKAEDKGHVPVKIFLSRDALEKVEELMKIGMIKKGLLFDLPYEYSDKVSDEKYVAIGVRKK